jgi:glutamate formiminotransferase / 5-formyltetrahydrofolate cyclo-ligase
VRRTAFVSLPPDTGPDQAHPTAGACAVGARPVLVAYNLWITAGCGSPGDGSPGDGSPGDGSPGDGSPSAVLSVARALATRLRGPDLRALGFARPDGAQVSINIIGPAARPLAALYDAVAAGAVARGCRVHRAELVGLVPRAVLSQANRERWAELDLDEDRTIEARMAAHGHELRDPPR